MLTGRCAQNHGGFAIDKKKKKEVRNSARWTTTPFRMTEPCVPPYLENSMPILFFLTHFRLPVWFGDNRTKLDGWERFSHPLGVDDGRVCLWSGHGRRNIE